MIALACSAAFPTIGSMITLMNETGTFHEVEAPYHKRIVQSFDKLEDGCKAKVQGHADFKKSKY
jgi:hypothetical protein